MMQTKAEQLAGVAKTFAVRLAEDLVLEMRNNDSIKITARSALSIASELRRLSPIEAERDKLLAVNKVLVGALTLCYDHSRLYLREVERNNVGETVRQALKLAGEIK